MNENKWACHVCTYENWPASKKCVICHTPKQLPRIEDEIYKLALNSDPDGGENEERPLGSNIDSTVEPPTVAPPPPPHSPSPPPPVISNSTTAVKWACPVCTYLNWPKARKCVQCHTPRSRRGSPTLGAHSSSPSNTGGGVESPLVVDVSHTNPPPSHRESPTNLAVNITPPHSTNQQSHTPPNESVSPPVTLTTVLQKWQCRQCTYENWPKNQYCVMCHTPREISQASAANQPPASGTTNRRADSGINDSALAASSSEKPRRPNSGQAVQPWSEDTWRRVKASVTKKDWLWLNACRGAVEGDLGSVEAYLLDGGSVNRKMTKQDCRILNRPHAYEVGLTLARLAVKFQREDLIDLFVSTLEKANRPSTRKRMPCHVSPELAGDIRRHFASILRQRKGDFPCFFVVEHHTFSLPSDIEDLPDTIQEHLFTELLDTDVQKELELDEKAINWWTNVDPGSRLFALWNRTAGDCLLDSVLQATWGILDRDNTLRTAMADSLRDGQAFFFPRWREYEAAQALSYQYTLDEYQWQRDWDNLLNTACQPGESLEQAHIFTLCHILRRPIIVYGVKYINNYRSEPIGISNFQGVYLPLLWERHFCSRVPIVLGYTRGHFSALVAMETSGAVCRGAGALTNEEVEAATLFLPLLDAEGKLLPVHFTTQEESRHQEALLRDWLDCCHTRRGLLMCRTRHVRRHPLVGQMLEEWMDHYRGVAVYTPPLPSTSCGPPDDKGSPPANQKPDSSDRVL